MKCPRCNSERTRLSWLREFTVVYWCTECHADVEIDRHQRTGLAGPKRVEKATETPATFLA